MAQNDAPTYKRIDTVGSKNSHDISQQIINELVTGFIEEMTSSITTSNELVSDQTKIHKRGLFIKQSPKKITGKSLLSKISIGKSPFVPRKRLYYIEPLDESDPNYCSIRVFLFDSMKSINVEASKENTVEDLLKHVFAICAENEVDNTLGEIALPYKTSDGYEMRLVDDGQPIYEMDPLDRTKQLGEYDLDLAAFCTKRNFHPFTRPACSTIFINSSTYRKKLSKRARSSSRNGFTKSSRICEQTESDAQHTEPACTAIGELV